MKSPQLASSLIRFLTKRNPARVPSICWRCAGAYLASTPSYVSG